MNPYAKSTVPSDVWQDMMEREFSNAGGRRKACKGQGLTGKEKRDCARQLKASGWKKGQPIPAEMSAVTSADVAQAEKEDALKNGEDGMSTSTKWLIGIGASAVVIVLGVLFVKAKTRATTSSTVTPTVK